MKYHVGIARRGDTVDGWVLELPGCRVIGGSVDEVSTLTPVVAAEYIGWLRSRGEAIEDPSSFDVVEDVSNVPDHAFEAEKAVFGDAEFETWLRWMAYAHADLEAIVAPLAGVVRAWRPPASAVKIDGFPEVRSIDDMLGHVRLVEPSFYVRNVTEPPGALPPPNAAQLPALTDMHHASEAALRSLSAEERSKLFERPLRSGGTGAWTVRKVIRRAISHKRFHTREIEQRLCWLTLGVPEILPVSRE